jgi:beta-lactamase class A
MGTWAGTALAAFWLVGITAQPPAHAQSTALLEHEMERVVAVSGGLAGACAQHLESGRRACFNGASHFPMASTVKVAIAIEMLSRADSGKLKLDRMVELQPGDQHPGSGVLTYWFQAPGVALSVRNLLELMMVISDNSATDILLRLVGGPDAVNARLRALGVDGVRVDRSTQQLILEEHADVRAFDQDIRDTATPLGMTQLLVKLWRREALKPESTALLLEIMRRCETGPDRLKGLLPTGTDVAHKTGTLQNSANDVGIVSLPDGTHVAIAVFVKASDKTEAEKELGIAEVSRAVHDYFTFVK